MLALRHVCLAALIVLLARAVIAGGERGEAADNWGQWRGPLATGVAPKADPPLDWNEADGKNIRWKTRDSRPRAFDAGRLGRPHLPHHGDSRSARRCRRGRARRRAITTTCRSRIATSSSCWRSSRTSGKILWQQTLHKALPHEQGHYTGSLASNSPVTDGEHLFAFFGSFGLYCLDIDGKLVWKADFGQMQSQHGHGEGSSPALHGDTLVVNWDHEGQVVPRRPRQAHRRRAVEGRAERGHVLGHADRRRACRQAAGHRHRHQPHARLRSGQRQGAVGMRRAVVEHRGLAGGGDGMVFAGSSYDKRALLAIRLDGAEGDITGTDQSRGAASAARRTFPRRCLYEGGLYFLTHYQGILSRVNARTGKDEPGAFRLEGIGNVYSSPVAAAGRVYITDLDGTTIVIKSGLVPQRLSVNRIAEPVSASAAIAGRQLFLRGERHLYCLEELKD